MSTFAITFEGPAALALGVVTELADADGVDLASSDAPTPIGDGLVRLGVVVRGDERTVTTALAAIRAGLPAGATIDGRLADDP
jgi:hypothetical protein